MNKCRFCDNYATHEKAKHCRSCNFAFMTGRQEALAKAKNLVAEVQSQAWIQERKRIVNLIEDLFAKSVVPGYQTAIADAIALIKVKTNE